jgi:hypothetical protein
MVLFTEGPNGRVDHWGTNATSRKVAGSIPDKVIEFFLNLPNSYSRNMALRLINSLT